MANVVLKGVITQSSENCISLRKVTSMWNCNCLALSVKEWCPKRVACGFFFLILCKLQNLKFVTCLVLRGPKHCDRPRGVRPSWSCPGGAASAPATTFSPFCWWVQTNQSKSTQRTKRREGSSAQNSKGFTRVPHLKGSKDRRPRTTEYTNFYT